MQQVPLLITTELESSVSCLIRDLVSTKGNSWDKSTPSHGLRAAVAVAVTQYLNQPHTNAHGWRIIQCERHHANGSVVASSSVGQWGYK